MALGKTLIIGGIIIIGLGASAGGTFVAMKFLAPNKLTVAAVKPKIIPPKPIYFAQIPDVVVSIPQDTGDPASSFVQFAVQFSSYDQKAVSSFDQLQPIIKAEIINLLMNETGKSLADPASRLDLQTACLGIANTVLDRSANYSPPNPFTAAYITNLVVQD
ncbi:MAG: flagellar basal body-associated FliL family protein [Acidocella sp.]|nr:flagellar basal body-associated FliL family protein [Acidocella sp.]